MSVISKSSRAEASPLDTDIQVAWDQANTALLSHNPDKGEVAGLAAALRHCAKRAKAIGFVSGEKELLRMAGYLDGRIGPAEYPRYATEESILM